MALETYNYPISGMVKALIPGVETMYYYTEEMLNAGVVFEWACWDDEDPMYQNILQVHILEDDDAHTGFLYSGSYLSSFQIYQIWKDAYEMFVLETIGDFIEQIRELSDSYYNASMQGDPKHRTETFMKVKNIFRTLRA
jgi:hypothetical protein